MNNSLKTLEKITGRFKQPEIKKVA